MALTDYKIPIIAGRNDVPTTSNSQENHPNGSFCTKKFNDLIEELIEELTPLVNAGGSTPRTNLNSDLYLDTSLSTNGNGTEANPFNNVASLVAKLNSSILTGAFPAVQIVGNVNLGDLLIDSKLTTTKDFEDEIGYLNFYSSDGITARNITIKSINSNIPILFNAPLKVMVAGELTIRNSEVVANEINGNVFLINSSLQVKTLTDSTVNLFNSHLTLLDGVATNVKLDAVQSSVTVRDVTTPTSVDTIENLQIRAKNSKVTVIDSIISNETNLVDSRVGSDVRLIGVTYEQISTEGFPKVLCDASSTYYQKDCIGFNTGEPTSYLLKVINGAVV